jgi:hypothetical protein
MSLGQLKLDEDDEENRPQVRSWMLLASRRTSRALLVSGMAVAATSEAREARPMIILEKYMLRKKK